VHRQASGVAAVYNCLTLPLFAAFAAAALKHMFNCWRWMSMLRPAGVAGGVRPNPIIGKLCTPIASLQLISWLHDKTIIATWLV
jgi:hypothetical protein